MINGCDKRRLPRVEVMVSGWVIVVVDIGREEVLDGGLGTRSEEEGYCVSVLEGLCELVKVCAVGLACLVEELVGKGCGPNGLSQKSGASGDFWVGWCWGGVLVLNEGKSLQKSSSPGAGRFLANRNACGGGENFGLGEIELDA